MARYVIGPDVAIRLAHDEAVIGGGHQILAPALLRSQVLSLLYQAVRRGEMTRKDAERQLEYVRGLRIRLLGDRVLQNVAWKAAVLLGWPDTFAAEYVALTQLHADALITLDRHLADAVRDLVTVAPLEALYRPKRALRAVLPAACVWPPDHCDPEGRGLHAISMRTPRDLRQASETSAQIPTSPVRRKLCTGRGSMATVEDA
jgi:predicted nucleic acid-binding protein